MLWLGKVPSNVLSLSWGSPKFCLTHEQAMNVLQVGEYDGAHGSTYLYLTYPFLIKFIWPKQACKHKFY